MSNRKLKNTAKLLARYVDLYFNPSFCFVVLGVVKKNHSSFCSHFPGKWRRGEKDVTFFAERAWRERKRDTGVFPGRKQMGSKNARLSWKDDRTVD